MVKSKQKFALASTTDFASKLRFSMLATITPKTQQQQKPEMFVLFSESLDVQAQTEIGLNGVGSQDLPGAFFVFGTAFLARRGLIFSPQTGDASWRRIPPRGELFSSRDILHHELSFLEAPPSVDTRRQALTWISGTSDANAVLAVAVAHRAGNKAGHH